MSRLICVVLFFVIASALSAQAQTSTTNKTTPKPSVATAPSAPDPKKSPEDCACESQVLPDALAIVNGVRISRSDIERATNGPVTELHQQFVDARKRELDLQINSKLLDIEAKRRAISTGRLLEDEVVARVKEPTQVEAQTFYNQNKARIEGDFAENKERVIDYLRDQRQKEQAEKFAAHLRKTIETTVLVSNAKPPANEAERGEVLAIVGGEKITSGDVENSLLPMLFATQIRVYQLRKTELDLTINDTLLAQEAQKRGVTPNALLDGEIKTKPVTDEEARKFYEENRTRVSGDFTQTRDAIVRYMQQNEMRKAERAFVEKLRAGASIQTFLLAPESPVFSISTHDQPSLGNAAAPVTIIEFTDFQCSSCAATHPTIARLIKEYGDSVRLVARDFPLSRHAEAFKAAEAAEAAREQGKYWEYVEILLRNQTALAVPKLKEYASELALDRELFDKALDSGKFADTVHRDIEEGLRLGINATPTLFINGRRVTDNDYDSLKATIESTLKALSSKVTAQTGK